MNTFEKLLMAVFGFIAVGMGYFLSVIISPWIGIPVSMVFIVAILTGLTYEREYRD